MMQPVIGKYRIGDKVRFGEGGKPMQSGEIICVGLNGYGVDSEGCIYVLNDHELIKDDLFSAVQENPRFSKGDKVLYIGENQEVRNLIWRIDGEIFYNDYYKCNMVSSLFNGETHICDVPLSDLIPLHRVSIKATAAESLIQMARDEMGIVDNEMPKSGTPDWLAYRMELAKAIAVAYAEKGRFEPKDIAANAMLVVDGIVERLKGSDKWNI